MNTEADVIVENIDQNYVRLVTATDSINSAIYRAFEFHTPNYRHDPRFIAGVWDGKVALYSIKTGKILKGLIPYVKELGKEKIFTVDDSILLHQKVNREELVNELATYGYRFKLDDSQVDAIHLTINQRRALIVSPVGSGKTAICYGYAVWHASRGKNVLIVIPEANLVAQFGKDIQDDFGGSPRANFTILGKKWKHTDPVQRGVTIVTQKSVYNKPKEWFNQFSVVIGDEAHKYSAPSYIKMVEKWGHIGDRLGCTGSLTEHKYNNHVSFGIFGKEYQVTTAQQQISMRRQAKPTIHAIKLTYSEDTMHRFSFHPDYKIEIDWLLSHSNRNQFIAKLASSLKGNVLTLYRFREHGDKIVDLIAQFTGQLVNQIDGTVKVAERVSIANDVRMQTTSQSVCTFRTFGTGVNIPTLNHLIKSSPMKSRTTNIQGDGRVVRVDVDTDKYTANIYDIYDQLVDISQERPNHTLRHYKDRLKIYKEMGYEVIEHEYKIE